jgi:hypothetical protein
LDLNKKKTGAMVHVEISLSEPLSETDIPTKQEKWLIIDEFNSNIYPLLASAQLIPQSMANYQPPSASPQISTPPQSRTPPPARSQPTIATEDKLAKPATDQATANNTSHEVVIPPKVAATEEESEFEKAEAEFNEYGQFFFLINTLYLILLANNVSLLVRIPLCQTWFSRMKSDWLIPPLLHVKELYQIT